MRDSRIAAKHPGALSARALLAQWIERARLTQGEAARQIGISRVKLNQYLNCIARPSLETAARIEDVAGIGMRLWLVDHPAEVRQARGDVGKNGSAVAGENVEEASGEVNIINVIQTPASRLW